MVSKMLNTIFIKNNLKNYGFADCFQREELTKFPAIGECLVNALGAVICGSQVVRYVAAYVLITLCA